MTIRQQLTAQKIVETNGNVSKAMLLAGYPPTTASNPQQVTRSKSWPALMEKYLPDSLLASKHNELLNKKEVVVVHDRNGSSVELTDQPDTSAVGRALDMAYKLKSKYPATNVNVSGEVAVVKVVKFSLDDKNKPIDGEVVE